MAENGKGGEGDGGLGGSGGESSSSTGVIPSVSVDIPAAARGNVQSGWRLGRQMHRIPLHLRLRQQQQQQNVYDPVAISIGPYHHGKPHLRQLEEFKSVTLELFLSGSDSERNREFFDTKIYEQIDEIRSCYVGVSANEYNDAALSAMMLRDASFIIYYMKVSAGDKTLNQHLVNNLGLLTGLVTGLDTRKFENQIPYWVIKFLMCSRFGKDEWKALLRGWFLNELCFAEDRLTTIPWEEGEGEGEKEEPLHLLEAIHWIFLQPEQQFKNVTTSTRIFRQIPSSIFKISRQYMCSRRLKKKEENPHYIILSRHLHSVTYLKAKGVHFRQSSHVLTDVRFESHTLYGKLLLPIRFVNPRDRVLYPNLIAFELSPRSTTELSTTDLSVTSYINFMKRLIENPKDVKELREQGILFSDLASDEEVVKLFQEIDTMGVHVDSFHDIKMSIKEHCKNKSKTWIAELINSNFRSPWTITALFAATVLLILTFLRTYYTIRAA